MLPDEPSQDPNHTLQNIATHKIESPMILEERVRSFRKCVCPKMLRLPYHVSGGSIFQRFFLPKEEYPYVRREEEDKLFSTTQHQGDMRSSKGFENLSREREKCTASLRSTNTTPHNTRAQEEAVSNRYHLANVNYRRSCISIRDMYPQKDLNHEMRELVSSARCRAET